jgi:RNA polymerase sigma-B factor
VPRRSQELALEIRSASQRLSSRLGRVPRVTELAQYMERDLDEIIAGLEIGTAQYADSLDAPVGEDDTSPVLLGETVGHDDEHYRLVDTAAALADAIPKLPYNERQALTMSLTDQLTQTEIARRLGCSQMQISRLIRRGKGTLREILDRSS